MPSERASQEERNGANFSFVAPSSEELLARKDFDQNALFIVHGFRPKTDVADFGKQGYHRKGHFKGNRMVQISAL